MGFLAFATVFWGPPKLQTWVGYTEPWLLLTSELAGLGHIVVDRFPSRQPLSDDATSLARKTHIPGVVWIVGWFAVICWSCWKNAVLLWG